MGHNRLTIEMLTKTVLLLLAAHLLHAPQILIIVLDPRALIDRQRPGASG
jgi:hypothetical protein